MARRAVVLGSGGILGLSWMVGSLRLLEERRAFEPRNADVIVGTSAGSVLAVLLAAGASTDQLLDHQHGADVHDGPLAGLQPPDRVIDTGLPLPRPWIGSPRLALANLSHLQKVTLGQVLASLAPAGRGSLVGLGDLVGQVSPEWAGGQLELAVVAMDYDSGRRSVFGTIAPETLPAGRGEWRSADPRGAVTASCAIPGWFAPVRFGGHRYVDGGAVSATSADLLLERPDLDEIYVLAPMAGHGHDGSPFGRLMGWWRRHAGAQTRSEVDELMSDGRTVELLAPTQADLDVAGPNLMDQSRRDAVLRTSLRTCGDTVEG